MTDRSFRLHGGVVGGDALRPSAPRYTRSHCPKVGRQTA